MFVYPGILSRRRSCSWRVCELHGLVSDDWKKEMRRWSEKGRNFAFIPLPETSAHAEAEVIVQCHNSKKAHVEIHTNTHIFIIHHVCMTVKQPEIERIYMHTQLQIYMRDPQAPHTYIL